MVSISTKSPMQRFGENISLDPSDGCWLWTGYISPTNGYGYFWDGERQVRVHRFAYRALVGEIPGTLCLDHLCCVKHCVNPNHLEAVTVRENTLRGTGPSAVNAMKTHCPRNHEYNEQNTYRDKKGRRSCRACRKLRKSPNKPPKLCRARRPKQLRCIRGHSFFGPNLLIAATGQRQCRACRKIWDADYRKRRLLAKAED